MADLGWQDLDSILRGLAGAGVAAGIAGASEAYDQAKNRLRAAAPVGASKRTVHFAKPKIAGGRTRRGGRTKQTINFAYADIDVTSFGDGAHVSINADAVMAPQGIYQNYGATTKTIHPVTGKMLGWMIGNRGTWAKSARVNVGGQHKGWIERALAKNVSVNARMSAAFSRQFTGGGQIRPHAALVLDKPFIDTSGTGAWFGENTARSAQKDLSLRRKWQAASTRAAGQWRRAYMAAIGRFT